MTERERWDELEAALVAEDTAWVMRITGLDRISANFMIGIGNGSITGDAISHEEAICLFARDDAPAASETPA